MEIAQFPNSLQRIKRARQSLDMKIFICCRGRMYDAGYRYEPEDDESESRSGESGSESATEEELAEYELSHQQRRRPLPPHDPRDLYYFYVIRLPNDLITHGVRRYPPPRGYESLGKFDNPFLSICFKEIRIPFN